MEIRIIKSLKDIQQATGLAVVIDVLRAFTTACYLFENGAKRIILVETIDIAFKLKKKHADYILVGEKQGLKIKGFDYGNSPAEIKDVGFAGKTIAMVTSAGTKGIINLPKKVKEIITASFVNAQAVIKHIKASKTKTVSFICTDDRYSDNEDFQCAAYIIDLLKGKKINFQGIKNFLINHPTTYGFLKKPLTKYSKKDFELCLELNKFSFIIKAYRSKNYTYLKI